MSSSPIANLGVVGGGGAAPGTSGTRRPRPDGIDSATARLAALPSDGELALASVTDLPVSNIIELEAPPLRRAAPHDAAHPPSRPRINPRAVVLAAQTVEALIVVAAGGATHLLTAESLWPLDPGAAFAGLAVMAMLVRLPTAEPRLLSEWLRRPLSRRLADGALRTLLPFVVGIALVAALLPAGDPARAALISWLALWAMGTAFGIAAARIGLAGLTARWRARGRFKQAVAIFGTGDLAERLVTRLRATTGDTIELIGMFDDRSRRRIASPMLRNLAVGTSDDLVTLSRHRDIDRVLVALPHAAEHRVAEIVRKLRQMPVEISLAPDLVGYTLPCRDPADLAGLPLIEVYGRPLTFRQVLLKGAVDRTLAALALVVGAPLLFALALAIKLDSRGPVLFRQNRDGFGDRRIGVYKFRTMYADATDHDCKMQTQKNDPRVTRVGRFLRRWSLDELPQLVNVLRGEMALVGPRPHAISMTVEQRPNRDIVPDYAMRHHMKPGITGWAQVNGYNGPVETEEALRARIRYDLEYISNWSFWFDFQILLRTVRIVLGQRRAY